MLFKLVKNILCYAKRDKPKAGKFINNLLPECVAGPTEMAENVFLVGESPDIMDRADVS